MTCSTCLESALSCSGFCLLHISIMVKATARKKERLHSCHYCTSLNPVNIPSSEKPYEHTIWASFFRDSVLLCRTPQAIVVEDFSFSCAVCQLRRSMPQRQWKKGGCPKKKPEHMGLLYFMIPEIPAFPTSCVLKSELVNWTWWEGIGIHEIWIETLTTANTHCYNSIETHIPDSAERVWGFRCVPNGRRNFSCWQRRWNQLHLAIYLSLSQTSEAKNVAMCIHSKQNMTHSPKNQKVICTSNTGASFLASLPSLFGYHLFKWKKSFAGSSCMQPNPTMHYFHG